MCKRRRIKETIKRILVTAMALVMVVNMISGFALNVDGAEEAQADTRVADASTVDSYESFLNIAQSTLYAGRIWTDKSVYALNGSNGSYSVNIDGEEVTCGVTPKDDFLEVFSALGSSAAVNGEEDAPLDVMFVLDMSGSMGESITGADDPSETRLAYAVNALNSAFDYVQNQNDYNRVGLYIYSGDGNNGPDFWNYYLGQGTTDAGNGLGILGLGRYSADNNEYFSVGGEGNSRLYPDAKTGIMGQVWMSVNVESTLINGKTVHDNREWGASGEPTGYDNQDHTQDYPLKEKIRAVGATNTQTGLYFAMDALAKEENTTVTINGEEVTRLPVVILLTDGIPTISNSGGNWWNPTSDDVQGSGNVPYCYGNYMLAMATASYMKREINLNYYGVSNPTGENAAKVFTFGIDLTDAEEQEIAEAFLNPKENFDSDTNTTSIDIKTAWGEYQNRGSVDIPVYKIWKYAGEPTGDTTMVPGEGGQNYGYVPDFGKQLYYSNGVAATRYIDNYYNGYMFYGTIGDISCYYDEAPDEGVNGNYVVADNGGSYTLTRPPESIENINTLIYNDEYRSVSSANLNTMLQEVLNSIYNTIAMPIAGLNDLDEDSVLSYSDPIGDYMQVNDIFRLNLLGKVYNVNSNGDGSYYVADSGGNRNVEIINTSYGEDSDVTFNLNEIVIQVESTITNGLKHDVLRVDIPAAALPIRTATIDYKLTHESGNTKQIIDKYTTNIENEDGSVNAAALPLRLFYTVGMQEKYLTNGSIDLSKISAEYKELHRNPETGRVHFYSNDYSSSAYIYNDVENLSDRGDAFTTFSAADSNRYYIYQDYLPLYTDPNTHDSYVTDPSQCKTDGIYYFDFKYYTADRTEKNEQIRRTGAMFGSGVSGSGYGEFLVWYNMDTEEVSDFTEDKPDGDKWIVATKVGGIRVGNMDGNSDKVEKGAGNYTGTSDTYYLPTVRSNNNKDAVILTNYLGNNGARSAGDVTLLLTKQVESDKADYQSEPFGFTVNIRSMANKENVTAIKYKLYSVGGSEYWLRMEESNVDVSGDGCLVKPDGTVTDIKVTDSTVTVSDDGKTGTVTATGGGEIVVYEVSFENGVPIYTYYYKINLQLKTESVTFSSDGTANVTLKHGEGLLFDGLENEEIRVTETLTKEQHENGYRFKEVQDESGKLPVGGVSNDGNDSKLYTVIKEPNSIGGIDNSVNNEIHWFNETVTPELEIEKTQSVSGGDLVPTKEMRTVSSGDEVTYYLTITNTGDATAEDVVVADVIPEGLDLKTIDNGGELQGDGKTIAWKIGNLDVNDSVTVSFTVTVPEVEGAATWTNIATVSFENNPENSPRDPNDSTERDPNDPHNGRKPRPSNEVKIIKGVPEPGTPEIDIEKTQSVNGSAQTKDKQTVNSGDEVTYYLTITNIGDATAEGVVVTDVIPESPKLLLKEIGNNGELLADNKTIVWKIGELDAQHSITVSFTVTVPEVDKATTWTNIATVSFENDPENPAEDPNNPTVPDPNDPHKGRKPKDSNKVEIIEEVPEPGTPKLTIEKTQSVNGSVQTKVKLTVHSGDEVTYYLKIKNIGDATAEGVVVTDVIPNGLTLKMIGNNGELLADKKTIVWKIGELDAEHSITVSFTVTVPEVDKATTWTNIATVSFENDPENPAEDPNNPTVPDPNDPHKGRKPKDSNEVEIQETVDPKVTIEKEQKVSGGERTKVLQEVIAGDEVTYYLKVTSVGKTTAKDVIVTDEIPDGLEPVENSISHEGEQVGNTIVWNLGNMEPNDSITVSFTVTVPAVSKTTYWKNIGKVSYDDPSNPPSKNPNPDDPHGGRTTGESNEVEIVERGKSPNPDESNEVEIVERDKVPKTGDDWNGMLWITLFAASGITLGTMSVTRIRSKKKQRKDK